MQTVTLYYKIAKDGLYGEGQDSDLSRIESKIETIRKGSQAANQHGNNVLTGWTNFKPYSKQPALILLGIEIHSKQQHLEQTLDATINHCLQPDYVSCADTDDKLRSETYVTLNKILEKHKRTVHSQDAEANQILAVVDLK